MRRWWLKIPLLLLAGAIVNVLVAWGCAKWGDRRPSADAAPLECPDNWLEHAKAIAGSSTSPRSELMIRQVSPATGNWACTKSVYSGGYVIAEFLSFGLPFRSLWLVDATELDIPGFSGTIDRRPKGAVGGLTVSTDRRDIWARFYTTYPIMPLPLGFTINTLIYATGLLGLWLFADSAASSRRRRIRVSRGHCVKCAYPVAGFDTCPECGTPVVR